MEAPPLHIAMFPWFAMGHLTPYLHLSNKLAKRGHRISFFVPKRTQAKLEQFNLHPHLITFFPLNVPHVHGLPRGAETTSDVSFSLAPLIMTAMDRTEKEIEVLLIELRPQIVFFDFTHWLPNLTRRLGIKSFQYMIIGPATVSYVRSPARMRQNMTETDLMQPPDGYPVSSIKLHAHEAKFLASKKDWVFGSGVLFYHRLNNGLIQSDAIGFKGCTEIEGPYVEYLENQFGKPVLLSGPIIPEPPNTVLEEKWAAWLGRFKDDSVIYCALGSEWKLPHDQFQELLLGLELTGLPFLVVLKIPVGFETIEAALPEGFKERVEGRGIVQSGWIQQQLILNHSSVGCFITHCGAGSLTEALVNKCQIVLLPQLDADHIVKARMMGGNLKVGVEVEKGEEDGLFTKESVCKAVKIVMDEENELGREVRTNHSKVKNFILSHNLESASVDNFCQKLRDLLRPEVDVIENIVQAVIKKLGYRFSRMVDDLIGIQPRVQALESILKLNSKNDDFRVLGICEMVGIGKTTHAAVLYDRISFKFGACCFIENVRKIYKDGGAIAIHKQILSQTFEEMNVDTYSPSEISGIARNRLHKVKVLVVLDNVDQLEQLQGLTIKPKLLSREVELLLPPRMSIF